MFTRSHPAEPQLLPPANANRNATGRTPAQPPRQRSAEAGAKSVIGNDLRIVGQGLKIISQGTLQVDGEIEGDVGGAEVIIGESGNVTGTVAAERVIVRGRIAGVIRGATVTLQSTAMSKATSITCRLPSSRAPSSMADAGGLPTPRDLESNWAARPRVIP
jgi:cytoskeletal protein CcmA (bactofilin family)